MGRSHQISQTNLRKRQLCPVAKLRHHRLPLQQRKQTLILHHPGTLLPQN